MGKTFIAVDPGKSGGLAFLYGTGEFYAQAMPATESDLVSMMGVFLASNPGTTVYVEKVGGFAGGRGQPGSAMFEFGKWAYGPVWIALCFQAKVVMITPQKWQKVLSLGNKKGHDSKAKTAWKNKLKAEAQRRFPGEAVTLKTADALLILEVAMQSEK